MKGFTFPLDEIDSLLLRRGESTEHEASRRLKTEFLLQFDGIGARPEERLLLLAATNRPEDLDEAVRRRFAKRIYVPLPDLTARTSILKELLGKSSSLLDRDVVAVAGALDGYSASDVTAIVKDAALGPIRELGHDVLSTDARNIRPVKLSDFQAAISRIKSSVDKAAVQACEAWNRQFGAF
jgi:SpoVK/Ycf46/Vps4 family AAA+-type ATPase